MRVMNVGSPGLTRPINYGAEILARRDYLARLQPVGGSDVPINVQIISRPDMDALLHTPIVDDCYGPTLQRIDVGSRRCRNVHTRAEIGLTVDRAPSII